MLRAQIEEGRRRLKSGEEELNVTGWADDEDLIDEDPPVEEVAGDEEDAPPVSAPMEDPMSEKELALMLGREQLKQQRAEVKEAMKSSADKELSDLLDEAIGRNQSVILNVHRAKGSGSGARNFVFISMVPSVNPQEIRMNGLEPLIQSQFGAGFYKVVVKANGIKDKEWTGEVGGETFQETVAAMGQPAAAVTQPVAQQMPMQGQMMGMGGMMPPYGMGYNNMMNPWSMPPWMNPYFQQPQQRDAKPDAKDEILTTLLKKFLEAPQAPVGPSPESARVTALEQEVLREREERRREADNHRWELQIKAQADAQEKGLATIREDIRQQRERDDRERERLASTPKENQAVKLAEIFLPQVSSALQNVITMMSGKEGDKVEQLREQMSFQKEMADRWFKMITERPAMEDRMMKVSDAVTSMMAGQVQMLGAMSQTMMQMQGPVENPWLSFARELIGGVTQVGTALLSGGPPAEEAASMAMQAPALPEASGFAGLPAARVIEDSGEDRDGRDEAEDAPNVVDVEAIPIQGQDSGEEVIGSKRLDTAFEVIFSILSNPNGNLHEVAWRIWKHAGSGVEAARQWWDNYDPFTREVLIGKRNANALSITDERIEALVVSIRELREWLDAKKDPEEFAKAHGIVVRSKPRK